MMTFRAVSRTPKSRGLAPERRVASLPGTRVSFFSCGDGCAFAHEGEHQPYSHVRVLPARAYKNKVVSRGFEPTLSAVQRQRDRLPVVSEG
jgi:hypothetical protein